MANNPFFSDTAIAGASGAVAAITGLLGSGFIKVYNGTQPADANTALSGQTLLATLTFGATAFGTPAASGSAGSRVVTATANAITGANAVATSTATWFRALKSDATTIVFDGSVGTSGADLNFSSVAFVSGVPIAISSFTVTETE